MSVFHSNTLIFGPKCWTCILRGPDFKIFPETRTFAARFFFSTYSKAFATYLKSYWKPWSCCNLTNFCFVTFFQLDCSVPPSKFSDLPLSQRTLQGVVLGFMCLQTLNFSYKTVERLRATGHQESKTQKKKLLADQEKPISSFCYPAGCIRVTQRPAK